MSTKKGVHIYLLADVAWSHGLTMDIYNLLWDIVLITYYTCSLVLFLFHNVIVLR